MLPTYALHNIKPITFLTKETSFNCFLRGGNTFFNIIRKEIKSLKSQYLLVYSELQPFYKKIFIKGRRILDKKMSEILNQILPPVLFIRNK